MSSWKIIHGNELRKTKMVKASGLPPWAVKVGPVGAKRKLDRYENVMSALIRGLGFNTLSQRLFSSIAKFP